jgi:polyhydroxyalkanoate synthesis regulator phasin
MVAPTGFPIAAYPVNIQRSAFIATGGHGPPDYRFADNLFLSLIYKKETPMFDLVRKSMLAGVGLALKAWDEVEDLAKEVAEQGKMTEQEGRKFIDDIAGPLRGRPEETGRTGGKERQRPSQRRRTW